MQELGVEQVYIDRMSGKNTDRPELKRMMNYVREGDVVIVEAISRFACNTKDLLENCKFFKKAGVTEIHNALDMDRLTNPNVRRGSAELDKALLEKGLKVIPMYWAEKYATEQLMIYQVIARVRGVTVPSYNYRLPVFEKLNIVADALNRAGIDPGKAAQYWDPDTKGIDDYLFSLRPQKMHQPTERTQMIQDYRQTILRINAPNE